MPIDTSIYGNLLRPAPSIGDFDAQSQQFQQNQLALQGTRQAQSDANALRQATQQFGTDPNANRQLLAGTGNFKAVQDYDKATVDNAKTRGEITLNASKTGEQDALAQSHALDTNIKNHDFHVQELGAITDPSQVPGWIADGVKKGVFTMDQASDGLGRFSQALQQPGGFAAWKQTALQGGVSATEQLKQKQAADLAQQAQDAENARNDASNRTHVQVAGMTQAGENSRAAAGRAQALTLAGMNPDGTLGENMQSTVDAIGKGQVQPPTGAALRNPRMAAVMDQVTKQYAGQDADHPTFDATNYGARQQAVKSFATGKDGQQVQAGNTALNHIATLKDLAAAQANGNTPMFNQLANRFAAETGNPAPTNLAAAITMVGPEISKAVIGAGGGQGDREHVDAVLKALSKGSPSQAAGTLGTITDLFGGRLQEQARTYQRTTGRKDFADTLLSPAAQAALQARGGSPGSAAAVVAHPADIQDLLNKYGTK